MQGGLMFSTILFNMLLILTSTHRLPSVPYRISDLSFSTGESSSPVCKMSMLNGNTDNVLQQIMDFIETAQYNAPPPSASSSARVPVNWRRYLHPNGDQYFFQRELGLITPNPVTDPNVLQHVLDARDDYLDCIEEDPRYDNLPDDYELVISEVDHEKATIMMYSRSATQAYKWTEDTGLVMKRREHFWSYVAEFPSHHNDLPPGTENECAHAIHEARIAARNGAVFHFSDKIESISTKYRLLRELRSQGVHVSPILAWLVGVLMPLDYTDIGPAQARPTGS